ncbi:MAG: uroporphyrinogen-III C-methyltransferase [Sedimentisphaerales bacterium]|nr:uroporphyrinogen-III C-methyltransferase [Sedimentisphaerales bacterium]
MKKPLVYLVGAGPGDPELITLKAIRCLSEADCVIYDGLANADFLEYAPAAAEKISVAKRGGQDSIKQDQINELLVQKALEGKTVVRLKGGDPTLFARGGEEAAALHNAGIAFEIVPGITAGLAAAEYSGIFLTDRTTSSQVMFVTGHPSAEKDFDFIDWDYLARFDGSIVLYMAMSNLAQIAGRLIAGGKPTNTPAAVIQHATLPDQKIARGPLDTIDALCKKAGLSAPAIVMIGKASDSLDAYNWFMLQPLFGKTIIATRDPAGNQRLGKLLGQQAAGVIDFSCIELQGPIESPALKHAIRDLNDYDWIVFTSSHGVDFTMELLGRYRKDSRAFGSAKIACIGKPTAESCLRYGIRADFVPLEFTGKALATELAGHSDLRRKNVLLLRSGAATDDLADGLRHSGAAVEDIRIYTTVTRQQPQEAKDQVAALIQSGGADWITFTSSSTVQGFFEQIDKTLVENAAVKIASIGPETTRQLQALDLTIHLEAKPHTAAGLVQSLAAYYAAARK